MSNKPISAGLRVQRVAWTGTSFRLAAGTDTALQNGPEVDARGYGQIAWALNLGDNAANSELEVVVQGTNTSGSGYVDLGPVQTLAIGNTDNVSVLVTASVHTAGYRYYRLRYRRKTANIEGDAVVVLLGDALAEPVTQPNPSFVVAY